jgi:hypothetical protein
MFRKSALLAVAATAALGFALLNPTLASARGHGGHGGGHHGGRRSPRPPRPSSPSSPRPSSSSPPSLARALSSADLVRRGPDVYRGSPGCRPVHLPEQGIHPAGSGAVHGPLHQRGGGQPAAPAAGCGRDAAADLGELPAGACEPAAAAAGALSQTLLVRDGEPRPCAGVLCYGVFSRDSTRALLATSLCRRCRNPAASRYRSSGWPARLAIVT